MSVTAYRLRVLQEKDFDIVYSIDDFLTFLRAWRHKSIYGEKCIHCQSTLDFSQSNFLICCQVFYFNPTDKYMMKSLAIKTKNVHLLPVYLKNKLQVIDQEFLVLPDPIYWQLESTLIYDSALKFLQNPLKYDDCCSKYITNTITATTTTTTTNNNNNPNTAATNTDIMTYTAANNNNNNDTTTTTTTIPNDNIAVRNKQKRQRLHQSHYHHHHHRKKKKTGSFHKFAPHLNAKLLKMYTKIQNAPLFNRSINQRSQGKESLYRKICIPKRARKTGRLMIVPAPHLKANEVVLPRVMSHLYGKYVILNRMPSLNDSNFVALKVVEIWDLECCGINLMVIHGMQLDYDGDECNVLFLDTVASQKECEYLLDSENNMQNYCNHIKLYPPQDMIAAFYIKNREESSEENRIRLSLPRFLNMVYELEGSKSCFDWFEDLRVFYLDFLENEYSFSVSLREINYLHQMAKGITYEQFEKALRDDPQQHEEGCIEIQVNSGSAGSTYHIYQLVGAVGLQSIDDTFEFVHRSFWEGLDPESYVVHAKSGHEALINSALSVWRPGYLNFKLLNNLQNIVVDYRGRLMDGEQVLYEDALEDVYYEDLISHETFDYLFDSHFENDDDDEV